jgi:hypothetical protein
MTGDRGPAEDPLLAVLDALEALGIRYQVGGSYASSVHGVPRQTRDADLVVELDTTTVPFLAERLESDFYLDRDRLRQAVARRASVNLIHLATGFKIDLFVKGDRPFDELELSRSQLAELPGASGRTVPFKTAEDTVLRKLWWFSQSESERQWTDVLGVLKVQRGSLDVAYLERWADELSVGELLQRALTEA